MVALEGVQHGHPWRLAVPLVRLLWECDARWPGRSKVSDGSIGDARHAAEGAGRDLDGNGRIDQHDLAIASQHNPDVDGWVHALDITSDPEGGAVSLLLVNAAIRHPAAWYVISNRTIWSRTFGWAPRPYHGGDPHTSHVHVSTRFADVGDISDQPWGLYPAPELATRKARPMMLYATNITDQSGHTVDTKPRDGQPDEAVYRPGLMLPDGRTTLVQLAAGTGPGTYHEYLSNGAGVVECTRDQLHRWGYVLPGEPGYEAAPGA